MGARVFGTSRALFYVALGTTIILLPLGYKELIATWNGVTFWYLLGTSVVVIIAAAFDFQSLKIGKMSVVEPIFAGEILIAALVSMFFLKEFLSPLEFVLALLVMSGIFLVSAESLAAFRQVRFETGVSLALVAMVGMGFMNVLIGEGAREIGVWGTLLFINALVTLFMIAYLVRDSRKTRVKVLPAGGREWLIIVGMSIFNVAAWGAFSFAVLYIPIAIATAISESYIALAALLGIIFNHERLRRHQVFGLLITVVSAIILAYLIA